MATIIVFVHPERRPIILVLVLVFVTKIPLMKGRELCVYQDRFSEIRAKSLAWPVCTYCSD